MPTHGLTYGAHDCLPTHAMQVGVPIGGSLQLLKTVAVQCGSCCGILSVALPPDEPPAPASVELLPLMQVPTVPCPALPLH